MNLKFLLIISIISLFILSGCSSQYSQEELNEFTGCLKESGLKMYSSFTCPVCAKQKALFGASFKNVEEIECNPRGENPQTDLCLERDIQKTPTWILEDEGIEIKRMEGYQNIQTLSDVSGCVIKNG